MNILLITPLNESFGDIVETDKIAEWEVKKSQVQHVKKLQLAYPNGLLSIAAYVKKHKETVNIKILDFNIIIGAFVNKTDGQADKSMGRETFWFFGLSELDGFVPDLIGISALFCSNFRDLNPLANFLRTKYGKGVLITCGGHLPSACYEDIFAEGEQIDAICFGEGEKPFLALVTALEEDRHNEFLQENDCWITKNKLQARKDFIAQNDLIFDLDEIPPYDLDVIVRKEGYADYS
jgi:hypothetical protein